MRQGFHHHGTRTITSDVGKHDIMGHLGKGINHPKWQTVILRRRVPRCAPCSHAVTLRTLKQNATGSLHDHTHSLFLSFIN